MSPVEFGSPLHECVRPGCDNRKATDRLICRECIADDNARRRRKEPRPLPPLFYGFPAEHVPRKAAKCYLCGAAATKHIVSQHNPDSTCPVCKQHAADLARRFGWEMGDGPGWDLREVIDLHEAALAAPSPRLRAMSSALRSVSNPAESSQDRSSQRSA